MKRLSVLRASGRIVYELHEYEFEALLRALRRDMRLERQSDEDLHRMNTRLDIRLLELLQPKSNPSPDLLDGLVTAALNGLKDIDISVDAV